MKRISNLQLITVLILLCIVGFQHPAYAQPRVDVETKDEIRLKSTDWLNGHGVDVYYPSDINKEHETKPDGTMEYECVELVVRLYKTVGYTNTWPNVGSASAMANVAMRADAARKDPKKKDPNPLPATFSDLTFSEGRKKT